MASPCPPRSEADEAFADLLNAVAPAPNDIVVLIRSYFDESWDDDILCVAGYTFTSSNARKFDEAWRRMLWKHGQLPYFRMSACNAGREPFDKLDKAARISAQTDAIALICKYASFGKAVTIDQHAYYRIIGNNGVVRSPYEFATWMILTAVLSWMEKRGDVGGASYFFEAGHQHQSQSEALMRILFKDGVLRDRYKYNAHAFVDKAKSRPSQAADMLSWQWFKNIQRIRDGATKMRADCGALVSGVETHYSHINEYYLNMLVEAMDRKAGGPGLGNMIAAMALRDPAALLRWQASPS
jgi:hypothetical protein